MVGTVQLVSQHGQGEKHLDSGRGRDTGDGGEGDTEMQAGTDTVMVTCGHRGDKEGGRSLGKCGGLAALGGCQGSASSLAADPLHFPSPDLCLSFPLCQMPP